MPWRILRELHCREIKFGRCNNKSTLKSVQYFQLMTNEIFPAMILSGYHWVLLYLPHRLLHHCLLLLLVKILLVTFAAELPKSASFRVCPIYSRMPSHFSSAFSGLFLPQGGWRCTAVDASWVGKLEQKPYHGAGVHQEALGIWMTCLFCLKTVLSSIVTATRGGGKL